LTTLRGSYDAFRRSVCSITAFMITDGTRTVQMRSARTLVNTATYTDTSGVKRGCSALAMIAVAALVGGCAARAGVPRPFPGAPLPPGAVEPVPGVVTAALEFRGVPYRNGGSDPSGFDCSGLVQYVFARFGTTLPREARDQYRIGKSVDLDDVEAGDLLFFETIGSGASHVGIVIGGGEFVHAPSSRGVVRVERYDGSYWARRFVGARRVAAITAIPTGRPPDSRHVPE
jgi:cell wall-associated NlpC family hydrolase